MGKFFIDSTDVDNGDEKQYNLSKNNSVQLE